MRHVVIVGICALSMWMLVFNKRPADPVDNSHWIQLGSSSSSTPAVESTIRAPGKIEGVTESIKIRSRVAEQILEVNVKQGQWVSKGEILVGLDTEHLIQESEMAEAMFHSAVARKQRLQNGARTSEIESAKNDYEATRARLWSARRALERGVRLAESKAIAQQDLDNLQANYDALRSTSAAAKERLNTLESPARQDDLDAADANVSAAAARWKIAKIKLQRATLRAPVSGRVLKVNARVGELTGPDSQEPLVIMVDTNRLYAVAEVDEFDALNVRLGQTCEITSDAQDGVLSKGTVVEVEPIMNRKKMYGQWADERNDTFSRRVRITLTNDVELPIGLPIEITIYSTSNRHDN